MSQKASCQSSSILLSSNYLAPPQTGSSSAIPCLGCLPQILFLNPVFKAPLPCHLLREYSPNLFTSSHSTGGKGRPGMFPFLSLFSKVTPSAHQSLKVCLEKTSRNVLQQQDSQSCDLCLSSTPHTQCSCASVGSLGESLTYPCFLSLASPLSQVLSLVML